MALVGLMAKIANGKLPTRCVNSNRNSNFGDPNQSCGDNTASGYAGEEIL
jgi:hypothetical protein